jgi:hypothetical protein
MTASAIQHSVANPLDFPQAALRHDVFEGLGQRQEVLGCPRISLGAIWVATAQCGPPSEFLQEPGNRWSVKFCREGHEDTGHAAYIARLRRLAPQGVGRGRPRGLCTLPPRTPIPAHVHLSAKPACIPALIALGFIRADEIDYARARNARISLPSVGVIALRPAPRASPNRAQYAPSFPSLRRRDILGKPAHLLRVAAPVLRVVDKGR